MYADSQRTRTVKHYAQWRGLAGRQEEVNRVQTPVQRI